MLSNSLNTDNFVDYIGHFFHKRGRDFVKSFSAMILGMMQSGSCSTGAISTSISSFFKKSFSASEKQVIYLLSNSKFQVDDNLWRCYQKMVFAFLTASSYIKDGSKIAIQVDHTNIDRDFLIMYASVVFCGKSIPIYFTKRAYPKVKGQMSRSKMEKAFIKGLRHCLSKKYSYIIVGDRGFGTSTFINVCEESGFEYIFRIKGDLKIVHDKFNKIEDIKVSKSLNSVKVSSWNKECRIIVKRQGDAIWYLCSNINDFSRKRIVQEYERRFKIEKCFFDQKSNGFNIEKTRVRKYERFGRLLFCTCVSQAFIIFTGNIIKNNHHALKKTSLERERMILAFSILQKEL